MDVFVIVVKTSLTRIPSKHGDVLLLPLCCMNVMSCQDTAWHWIGLRILYQIPKRGDSSVMFEIPKETTMLYTFSASPLRQWEVNDRESDCRAPTGLVCRHGDTCCQSSPVSPLSSHQPSFASVTKSPLGLDTRKELIEAQRQNGSMKINEAMGHRHAGRT